MPHETGHRNLRELAEPFFEGCRNRQLLVPQCVACNRFYFYSSILCPHCQNKGFLWTEVSGRANLYSYTELLRPMVPQLKDRVPYVVACVELEEGVRMMSNVVDYETDELEVGLPLNVDFTVSWDGRPIPVFRPVRAPERSL